MGYEDDRALVGPQGLQHLGAARRVEVVRRLVEQQHVGRGDDESGEGEPGLLATRERPGELFDPVAAEKKRAQHPPQL